MQIFAHFVVCVLKGNFLCVCVCVWELLRIMKVKSHSLCLPPENKPKYKCSLVSFSECRPHWGCPAMNHILLETDLRVTSAFVHTEYKVFIPRDTITMDCDCVVWQQVDRAQESMYVALWKDLWVTAARQSLKGSGIWDGADLCQ